MMTKTTYKFGLRMINDFYEKAKNDCELAILHSEDVEQWWIKNSCTKTFWNKFKAGEITADDIKAHAKNRRLAQIEKDRAAAIAKLVNMSTADKLARVDIDVEWTRSMWGRNPKAHAVINDRKLLDSRSVGGCGYDKRSAATAEVLNNSIVVMAALLELARQEAKTGNKTYGYSMRGALPFFEGGVGFESHRNILNAMGLKTVECNERCATHDYYLFVKGK